jgi:hypothetical protein
MKRFALFAIALFSLAGLARQAGAVNLVLNGDFENLTRNAQSEPTLDAYGHEQPTNWFRATRPPAEYPVPATDLITPANMNNAAGNNAGDDSDGNGTNSAAMNFSEEPSTPSLGTPADWRSWSIDTVPGETLIFSMDFKFIGVDPGDFMGLGLYNGMLAQIRSFAEETAGHSTDGQFMGERNSPVIFRTHYAPDVWHNVTDRVVIPDGGEFTDIRISVNTFPQLNSYLFQGQVLIDDVQLIRLTADFDDDLDVDGADLDIWQANFGIDADGDANADGVTDGADFISWQQENGSVVPEFLPPRPPDGPIVAVPEPAGLGLVVSAFIAALLVTQKRQMEFS